MPEPIECCGSKWGTNFCPTCGKRLMKFGDLPGLLRYLRTMEEKARVELERRSHRGQLNGKYVEHKQGIIDKWQGWADKLESLIDKPNFISRLAK